MNKAGDFAMADNGMCTGRQYMEADTGHAVPESPAKEVLWERKISD